jgi:hypothetical protein
LAEGSKQVGLDVVGVSVHCDDLVAFTFATSVGLCNVLWS